MGDELGGEDGGMELRILNVLDGEEAKSFRDWVNWERNV